MTKKKQAPSTAPNTDAVPKRSNKPLWIAVAAVVAVVIALFALNKGGGSGTGGSGAIPPEEAKYMGRLLPAGYEEPNVGGVGAGDAIMAPVTPTDAGDAVTVLVADVKASKIVSFDYQKESGETIPLLAYVKPSGKLFVGVNYCPPCKGLGQNLQGGTLTCQTCGTKREPESGVGISGACKLYPVDELPAKVDGDKVVIEKAAIDKWTPQPLDRPTNG